MRLVLSFLFLSSGLLLQAQCKLLDYISDTVTIGESQVIYVAHDSVVKIQYIHLGVIRELPDPYTLDCNLRYIPSVWAPNWSNDRYIGLTSGCGSWCFGNILVPLNDTDLVMQGGQILFDTLNSMFFSLYRDTVNYDPYVEIQNFNTHQSQSFDLNSDDFYGAILLERLDYNDSHPKGFLYRHPILSLFVSKENEIVRVELDVSSTCH